MFSFSVAQVLVGLQKQFISNFAFPTWACAAAFNKNNKSSGSDNMIHFVLLRQQVVSCVSVLDIK